MLVNPQFSSMPQRAFLHSLELLKSVQLPNGGVPYHSGEEARPDTTAWAIISMSAWEFDREGCDRGRAYLVSQQANDGRISISPAHPDASWPTPLAIMAWQHFLPFRQTRDRAVQFLLGFAGHHFKKADNRIAGHDPSIVGWPWIADTHSWVIPTGLAMTALQQLGLGTHARVVEGQQMLLDRQLPHGGWNYGNTFVFGKELHPLPECTGIALQALAGTTPIHEIERSLDYLLHELSHIRTPISLGWALLGLGAWGLKPADTEELALASLQRQDRYGPYPVPSLALLLCAVKASQGLHSLFRSSPQETLSSSAHH
jgi:hypothetical protein